MQDPMPGLSHPPKRVLRWNAVLTVVLVGVIAALSNVVAGRYLRLRTDFSSDGLNEISEATRGIIARAEDQVTVRLYATEDVKGGQLALRTARIRGQLDEILRIAPGTFALQVLDPSRSSEAARKADDVGFKPTSRASGGLGSRGGTENVWLSLELGYRGRIESIPTPRPFEFETQFGSALHSLLSDRRPGVGWLGAPVAPVFNEGTEESRMIAAAGPSFRELRATLERRATFEEIQGLDTGRSIPDEIDVLFLVIPDNLSERVVREIERFVRRGGKLIVCFDNPVYNGLLGTGTYGLGDFRTSMLGQMLESWGIGVHLAKHIWDGEWKSQRVALASAPGGGGVQPVSLISPMVITVPDEGLSDDLSPTRGVERVQFSWAHPIVPTVPVPAGVTRENLAWSSSNAWLDDAQPNLTSDAKALRTQLVYLRRTPALSHVIAAAFSGVFPRFFWEEDPAAGGPDSPRASQVVVFGDADWLRDPAGYGRSLIAPFNRAGGIVLAENLVDWLTMDEALIGLRSRAPRLRPLRDFETESLELAGVFERDPYETESERLERDRKSDRARARARRLQWLTMLAPAAGALLVVALFGLAWNLAQRRREDGASPESTGEIDGHPLS